MIRTIEEAYSMFNRSKVVPNCVFPYPQYLAWYNQKKIIWMRKYKNMDESYRMILSLVDKNKNIGTETQPRYEAESVTIQLPTTEKLDVTPNPDYSPWGLNQLSLL